MLKVMLKNVCTVLLSKVAELELLQWYSTLDACVHQLLVRARVYIENKRI